MTGLISQHDVPRSNAQQPSKQQKSMFEGIQPLIGIGQHVASMGVESKQSVDVQKTMDKLRSQRTSNNKT